MSLAVTTTAGVIGVAALLIVIVLPGLVTCLKGHWELFDAGILVVGTVWWFSALRLARPGSLWARTFYGHRKTARAIARYGWPDVEQP